MRSALTFIGISLLLAISACGGGGGGDGGEWYENCVDPEDCEPPQPPFQSARFQLSDLEGDIHDTVRDTQTGLTWHRNAGLPAYVEGWSSSDLPLENMNTFIDIVNANELGGYTNWRIPKATELHDLWQAGVAHDDSFFTSVWTDSGYWCSDYGREKCVDGRCYHPHLIIYFDSGGVAEAINRVDYRAMIVRSP